MNISPDYLIERKRNKMQLTRWKMISFILVVLLIFFAASQFSGRKNFSFISGDMSMKGDYIANILLQEVINDDLAKVKKLEKIVAVPHIFYYDDSDLRKNLKVVFKPKFASRFTHF